MKLFAAIVIAALTAGLAPAAGAAEPFELGVHYEALPIPVATRAQDGVEVIEVFSYACVHCFNFDPVLEDWRDDQGDAVAFGRVPAIFNDTWAYFAQAFYAAEVLGVTEQVHGPIFAAIHLEGLDLREPALLADIFEEAAGVDPEEFLHVFNSFGVRSKVQQADARTRMYRVTGVPTMIVAGKYRIDGTMAGNNTKMLQVVDYLVARERQGAEGDTEEAGAE